MKAHSQLAIFRGICTINARRNRLTCWIDLECANTQRKIILLIAATIQATRVFAMALVVVIPGYNQYSEK